MIICPNIKHPDWISAVKRIGNEKETLLAYYILGDRIPSRSEVNAYLKGFKLTAVNDQVVWDVENAEPKRIAHWRNSTPQESVKTYHRYTALQADRLIADLSEQYKESRGRPVRFKKVAVNALINGKRYTRYEIRVVDTTFRSEPNKNVFGEYIEALAKHKEVETVRDDVAEIESEGNFTVVDGEILNPEDAKRYQMHGYINENLKEAELAIRELAYLMADKIGGRFIIVNDENLKYSGANEGLKSIINLARATLDTPIHEIVGHPIVTAVKNSNPELYKNLLKELEYGYGKEVYDRIKKFTEEQKLTGRDIPYITEDVQEETIVQLLGEYAAGKIKEKNETKNLFRLLRELWERATEYMRSLLKAKEIEVEKLRPDLTIGELSDLLAYSNGKIILPGGSVRYTAVTGETFPTYYEAERATRLLLGGPVNTEIDLDTIEIPVEELENSNKEEDIFDTGTGLIKRASRKFLFGAPYVFIPHDGSSTTRLTKKQVLDIAREWKEKVDRFVDTDKYFSKSKLIVDTWKTKNNIQYNPEEAYSRGHGFYSNVGAFAPVEIETLFQNLLQHIEDNRLAGTEFTISAFTADPNDSKAFNVGHKTGIRYVIYPRSQDIKWVAHTDIQSGSVYHAHELVDKNKKTEQVGVSHTKAPLISHLKGLSPNIADTIDNHTRESLFGYLSNYNEMAIELTFSNFRIEYDVDVDYRIKKLANTINSILDEKYGKIEKPKIEKTITGKKPIYQILHYDTEFGILEMELENPMFSLEYTKKEAALSDLKMLREQAEKQEHTTYRYELITKESKEPAYGIAPVKTKENTTSIDEVKKELAKENINYERLYREKAVANLKIGKLKQIPRKYQRSLIISQAFNQQDVERKYQMQEAFAKEEAKLENYENQQEITEDQKLSEQTKKEIEFLRSKLPVDVEVIVDENMDQIARVSPRQEDGSIILYVNPTKLQDDSLGHEFGHILIDLLGGMSNPFIRLGRNQLIDTEIEAEVLEKYPDLIEEKDERVDKEILATAVGMETAKIFAKEEQRNNFEKWLVRFFRKVRRILGIEISVAKELAQRLVYDEQAVVEEEEASKLDLSKGLFIQGQPANYYQDSREKVKDLKFIDEYLDKEYKFKLKATDALRKKIRIYQTKGGKEVENIEKLKEALKVVERTAPTISMLHFIKNAVKHVTDVNNRYLSKLKREDMDITLNDLYRWKTYVSAYDILDEYRNLIADTKKHIDAFATKDDLELLSNLYDAARPVLELMMPEEQVKRYKNVLDAILPILDKVVADKNSIKNLYKSKGEKLFADYIQPYVTVVEAEYRREAEREYNKKFTGEERKATPFDEWWARRLIDLNEEIQRKTRERIMREIEVAPDDISQIGSMLDTLLNSPDMITAAIAKAFMENMYKTRFAVLEERYNFVDRIEALEKQHPRSFGIADEDYFDYMLEISHKSKFYSGYLLTSVSSALREDYETFLKTVEHEKTDGSKSEVGKKASPKEIARRKREWFNKHAPRDEDAWLKARLDFLNNLVEEGKLTKKQVEVWESNLRRPEALKIKLYDIFEEKEEALNKFLAFERKNFWNYRTLSPYYERHQEKWNKLQEMRKKGLVNGVQTDERIIFYDFIVDKLDKAQGMLPIKYRLESRLPSMHKNFGDRVKSGEGAFRMISRDLKQKLQRQSTDTESGFVDEEGNTSIFAQISEEFSHQTLLTDESGEEVRMLPMHHVNRISPQDQFFDVTSLYFNYLRSAMEYHMRSNMLAEFEYARQIVQTRDYARRDSKGKKIINALFTGKDKSQGLESGSDRGVSTKPGETSNLARMFESFLKINLYGITKAQEPDIIIGGMTINRAKLLDGLSKYTALSMLGFNVIQGFANVAIGETMQAIEAVAGRYIKPKHLTKGTQEYYKNYAGIISDIGMRKPSSLVGLLTEKFNILDDYTGGRINKNHRWRELMNTSTAFFLSHAGEHFMQVRFMLALLEAKQAKDKDGKALGSMLSFYSVEGGRLIFDKEGKVANFTEKDQAAFGAYARRILARLHGEYSREGQNAIQSVALGRMAIMFRKFVVPGFKRRWESERYNEILEEFVEGNYITFGRFFGRLVKDVWHLQFELLSSRSELTQNEKANIIRTLTEITTFIALLILSNLALKRLGDDDDEFDLVWTHLAYQTLRLRSELAFFTMPSEAMKILRSPAASVAVLENIGKGIGQLMYPVTSLKFEFEQYQQGPWKDKAKIRKTMMQLTPGYKQFYRIRDLKDQINWWDR